MEVIEIAYVCTELPTHWKPYYIYDIMVVKTNVGKIVLREGSVEERYFDGHIGYTIEPLYRGHYYAYEATKLVLKKAKEKGFTEIIITCSPDNIASKKTIKKVGANYIETKEIPKVLKKYFSKEETVKEIYSITL